MKKLLVCVFGIYVCLVSVGHSSTCNDARDTYDNYDRKVTADNINNIKSEYYVMSYSWSPRYCNRVSDSNKKPGKKDYLQCGSGKQFGYILHGLWPQGSLHKAGNYPRACEGDQPKIKRTILEKYLCMTPSVGLLQHEYEYHGTCMHDEKLETPDAYFGIALKLHSELNLPDRQLDFNKDSIKWFIDNNPHLTKQSILHDKGSPEWRFCYDNNFNVMNCPSH